MCLGMLICNRNRPVHTSESVVTTCVDSYIVFVLVAVAELYMCTGIQIFASIVYVMKNALSALVLTTIII